MNLVHKIPDGTSYPATFGGGRAGQNFLAIWWCNPIIRQAEPTKLDETLGFFLR